MRPLKLLGARLFATLVTSTNITLLTNWPRIVNQVETITAGNRIRAPKKSRSCGLWLLCKKRRRDREVNYHLQSGWFELLRFWRDCPLEAGKGKSTHSALCVELAIPQWQDLKGKNKNTGVLLQGYSRILSIFASMYFNLRFVFHRRMPTFAAERTVGQGFTPDNPPWQLSSKLVLYVTNLYSLYGFKCWVVAEFGATRVFSPNSSPKANS